MIAYRKIKLVEHILKYGLTNPTRMGIVDSVPEDKKNGIITIYDKALLTIGFDKYIFRTYGVKPTNAWTLHEVFIMIMAEFLGEEHLNNHEKNTYYKIENQSLREVLHSNSRYLKDLEYYNSRVLEDKEDRANQAFVIKSMMQLIDNAEVESITEETKTNMVMKFEDKMTKAKIKNYDERIYEVYKAIPNLPFTGHIHPNVFLKLSKFILPFTQSGKTFFQIIDEEPANADMCEVLILLLLESKLVRCYDIVHFLKPIIDLGDLYSNMVSVAYLVPEIAGSTEYIKISFRYEEDVQIVTDRKHFKDIMQLRGLTLNRNKEAIIKKDGTRVWDVLFKGAYKPKNGDYNDIREVNLTK